MTSEGKFSKSAFDRLRGVMAGHVERGDVPGLVMLVSQHGEVQADAIGRLAFEGSPMLRDSLFRITSMTKPVAASAVAGACGTLASAAGAAGSATCFLNKPNAMGSLKS